MLCCSTCCVAWQPFPPRSSFLLRFVILNFYRDFEIKTSCLTFVSLLQDIDFFIKNWVNGLVKALCQVYGGLNNSSVRIISIRGAEWHTV